MKILCINSNAFFKKGSSLYIYRATGEFFRALQESGHCVSCFHFIISNSEAEALANFNLSDAKIRIVGVRRFRSKVLSHLMAYPKGLLHLFRSDFLYLFYPNAFYPLALIAAIIGKPYALYVRGEKGLNSIISKFLFKKAQFVLTVSPKFTNIILEVGGIAKTIKPMMEFKLSDVIKDRIYKKRERYNLLYLGRIEVAKGIFDLLHALNNLRMSGICNWRLDIVGDGPDYSSARQVVNELGLNQYVVFHGPIYNSDVIKKFYLKADIYLLPTHHEGFPRVLYESMIFAVPIITTFVGSIPYLMKDGCNAVRIEPRNIENIECKVKEVIANYESIGGKIAKNGTHTIEKYLKENNLSHIALFTKLINCDDK